MTFPFEIYVISTSLREKMTLFGDPMWFIWYTDKRLKERLGTYSTLLNLPWSRSILPFPKLSVRESYPSTIGGPLDMSREENASLVETICLEAPESMVKLGELDVPATNACTLSVLWIWSPFPLLWGIGKGDVILLQELGQHVNFLLHTRALRMIALTVVCALAHFSFILLLMGVLLGALGLVDRPNWHKCQPRDNPIRDFSRCSQSLDSCPWRD